MTNNISDSGFQVTIGDGEPVDVSDPREQTAHATRRQLAGLASVRGAPVTLSQGGAPALRVLPDGTFEVLQKTPVAEALADAASLERFTSSFLRQSEISLSRKAK